MLMLCASHPSEKLISSCSTVVKIAMADCVRPMKCRGTIDINDDCATTPDIARQNPKIICTNTAPATYDTHGTMKCPALRTATDVTYNVIRHPGESWLATNPPDIAPTAQPPSRNPRTRAPPPRISLTRDTSTTLPETTPAIIAACVIPSARTRGSFFKYANPSFKSAYTASDKPASATSGFSPDSSASAVASVASEYSRGYRCRSRGETYPWRTWYRQNAETK